MENFNFRSKSHKDPQTQLENNFETGIKKFRSYSANNQSSNNGKMEIVVAEEGEQWKFQKGRSIGGFSTKNWCFNDPELQRKKTVASYKVYSVEGKVKGSIKKSFRWIKERCNKVVNGYK